MAKPRLVFIAHRLPYPPDKGERLRAFHEIRILRERFDVTVAALTHHDADRASAEDLSRTLDVPVWTAAVDRAAARPRAALRGLLTGRSVTECYFRSASLGWRIVQGAGDRPWDVAFGYCSSVLPYVLAVPARRRVIDLVDVDSAKWSRYAETARWPVGWFYRREARRVADLERRAVSRCDAVTLVSAAEADLLPQSGENVHPLGNGVDTTYFDPAAAEPADLGPHAVVFTGTMDYPPNAEGVTWFVRDVWPAVREAHPDAAFAIVGRDPTPAVRALAEAPGVRVTGGVPDVRPYLSGARLAVCPLLTARGIQNKVLEALAMALPVLATSAAAEGIELGDDASVLRTADGAEAWRAALIEALSTPAAPCPAARDAVLRHYSWSGRMADLCSLAEGTLGSSR